MCPTRAVESEIGFRGVAWLFQLWSCSAVLLQSLTRNAKMGSPFILKYLEHFLELFGEEKKLFLLMIFLACFWNGK